MRGWLARKPLLPLLATLRTQRKEQEAKQAWVVVLIQARARGHLVRQWYSEAKEKRKETFSRAVVSTQARARGYLVRNWIKDEMQRLRDARHEKWKTLITSLQANCRGNLIRRMTGVLLEEARKRRVSEEVGVEGSVTSVQAREREINIRQQQQCAVMVARQQQQCAVMMARQRQCKEQESEGTNITTPHQDHHHVAQHQQTSTARTENISTTAPNTSLTFHTSTDTPLSGIATPTSGSNVVTPTDAGAMAASIENPSSSDLDMSFSTAVSLTTASLILSGNSRGGVQLEERAERESLENSRKQDDVKDEGRKNGKEKKTKRTEEEEIEAETVSMQALAHARSVEMIEAKEARQRMDALCSTHELLDLAREGRNRPGYVAELEHASKPLPGPALLGLVHERMVYWQEAQKKRKQLDNKHRRHRKDIPCEDTSKSILTAVAGSRLLTPAQLLGASPKGTELGDIVQVMVYGSRHPVALSCLEVCPRLRSASMTKCGLKALAGLRGCPLLTELHMPVYNYM